jgi:hypothetical protein
MKNNDASDRHLLKSGGHVLAHTIAVVAGLALAIVGLGLGVTIVLLPIGLPVGLTGLALLAWGLWFTAPQQQT